MTTSVFNKQYPMLWSFGFGEKDCLIYDSKADFVFILTKQELDALNAFLDGADAAGIEAASRLDSSRVKALNDKFTELRDKCGLFIPGPLERVGETDLTEMKKVVDYFDSNILVRKFVLEVTEDCNYRCTYCNNTLADNFRQHSKLKMSNETAKNSIDYYFSKYIAFYEQLSPEKKRLLIETLPPALSWYGGEPMLNFELIEWSAEYFRSLDWEKYDIPVDCLQFVCNTNLSVMNDRILQFISKYKVRLFTSLDGPKEENDKCRVFTNGQGTFDIAYRNLLRIKEYDPEYFNSKVSVIAVEDDVHDHTKCHEFLDQLGIYINYTPRGYSNCVYKDAKERYKDLSDNFEEKLKKTCEYVRGIKSINDNSDFFMSLMPFMRMCFNSPRGTNKQSLILSCPMGVDNAMIGVNGEFHVCHKTDGSMPFGNINDKTNLDGLAELYCKYNEAVNKSRCRSCWAVSLCWLCAVNRMQGGEFVEPSAEDCITIEKYCEYFFNIFIFMYNNRPDLLEELQNKINNRREYITITDVNTF